MKKSILIAMLVMTGMTGHVLAQSGPSSQITLKTKTEQLFDFPYPDMLRHNFIIALKNGNHVTIQLADKTELEKLMNMDSLLREVSNNLAPFRDSLLNELTSKRIDYLDQQTGNIKIRMRQSKPAGYSYVLSAEGPSILKVDQDTLIITSYRRVVSPKAVQITMIQQPYRITLLLNDILRLNELLDGTINMGMQQIKQQWDGLKRWSPKNNAKTKLYSVYNANNPAMNRPIREPHLSQKLTFGPYVQVGLQNINNMLVTSAGAGFQLIKRVKRSSEFRYQLFWEPYFLFDKNTDGKFKMRRNDFITFQYLLQSNFFNVEFSQNFSISYLFNQSGNFFNKNTFKFGLPGARFKVLHLHPEFIFNDLFKNFQPGLKLFLDLD